MNFIIMAGGKSLRLFPLTRENYPKQFINIFGCKNFIEATIERIKKVDLEKTIYVVGSENHRDLFYHIIKNYPDVKIIYEPEGKNTFYAICYTLSYIKNDEPVVCLPSDHFIGDEENFNYCIKKGIQSVNNNLILIGIKPDRPETGYGYIEFVKENLNNIFQNGDIYNCKAFYEKPDYKDALRYLESGNFLWNSGIFIFQKSFIYNKINNLYPNIYKELIKLNELVDKNNNNNQIFNEEKIKNIYSTFSPLSFDKAICEKISEIKTVYCDCNWSDLGTFESILELCKNKSIVPFFSSNFFNNNEIKRSKAYLIKDKEVTLYGYCNEKLELNRNKKEDENILINKKDKDEILIFGDEKIYIINEIQNIIIVDMKDILYISKKDTSSNIKEFINFINKKNYSDKNNIQNENMLINTDYLKYHKTIKRPWGIFTEIFNSDDGYKIKRIEVFGSESISLQFHNKRDEHWIIVKGSAIIQLGDKKMNCKKGDHFFIQKGQLHRIINENEESLVFIEVQIGDYLEEDDIVRIEDKYDRLIK
ncbi:MAG: sugar phosphate nucleotidyltransferase [Spirochaetes bacterium]|nr:sugar phosphate nucleotidyltransferase [Spirochaetota bacterium]